MLHTVDCTFRIIVQNLQKHLINDISDILIRPSQEVDVLAVLDFQIPCFRPETPAFYARSELTNHEGRGREKDVWDDFRP